MIRSVAGGRDSSPAAFRAERRAVPLRALPRSPGRGRERRVKPCDAVGPSRGWAPRRQMSAHRGMRHGPGEVNGAPVRRGPDGQGQPRREHIDALESAAIEYIERPGAIDLVTEPAPDGWSLVKVRVHAPPPPPYRSSVAMLCTTFGARSTIWSTSSASPTPVRSATRAPFLWSSRRRNGRRPRTDAAPGQRRARR